MLHDATGMVLIYQIITIVTSIIVFKHNTAHTVDVDHAYRLTMASGAFSMRTIFYGTIPSQ